jgi:hypothetical protein
LFALVAAGLILGFGVSLVARSFDQSASMQEHYMLLVSDLYAKGVPVDTIRNRLVNVGFSNPSVAVVGVANQLTASSDPVKQQEANQLHQFAEALAVGSVPDVNPTIAARLSPTPDSDLTSTPVATVPAIAPIDATTPTEAPTATVTPQPPDDSANQAPAPSSAAATPAPAPASSSHGKTGVVRSADRQPVFYRKQPSSKAAKVGVLPYGSTVTILSAVQGEAVVAGDKNWYHISANGHDGYIYAQLVQVGG